MRAKNLKVKIVFGIIALFAIASRVDGATMNKPINNLGMVGYWTFDGKDMTPNVRDISGQGNHGNLLGQNSTSTVLGRIGQALKFDGVDDNAISGSATFVGALNQPHSMFAWVYPNRTDVVQGILSFGEYDDAGNTTALAISASGILTWNNNGTLGPVSSGLSVPANTWSFVGFSRTATNITFYVNGTSATVSNSGSTGLGSDPFLIGATARNASVEGYFDGIIDDARIYNRAIGATETSTLYNSGAAKLSKSRSPGTLSDGLVGHWTFDGKDMTPNVRDVSGQGNHGNITGQTSTTTVIGKVGQALDFDNADDLVDTGASSIYDFTDENMTVSAWVKPDGLSETDTIIGRRDVGLGGGWGLFIDGAETGDPLQFTIFGAVDRDSSASGLIPNAWNHVAVTYDKVNIVFYVNGSLLSSHSYTGDIVSAGSQTLYLGALNNTGVASTFFNGGLDDVRVYNRALTATEISKLYNLNGGSTRSADAGTGSTISEGLMGYWSFDGAQMVPSVRDSSGQGNHGNITGQTSTTTVIGKVGQALQFDGVDDLVTVGDVTTFDPFSAVTYCAWVKPGILAVNKTIVGKYDSVGLFLQSSDTDSTRIAFGFNATSFVRTTSSSFVAGQWTHVCGTFDNNLGTGKHKVYANGVSVGLSNVGTPDNVTSTGGSSGTFEIGSNNALGRFWSGAIDEVRVYNRALSSSEVKQLYNMGM